MENRMTLNAIQFSSLFEANQLKIYRQLLRRVWKLEMLKTEMRKENTRRIKTKEQKIKVNERNKKKKRKKAIKRSIVAEIHF